MLAVLLVNGVWFYPLNKKHLFVAKSPAISCHTCQKDEDVSVDCASSDVNYGTCSENACQRTFMTTGNTLCSTCLFKFDFRWQDTGSLRVQHWSTSKNRQERRLRRGGVGKTSAHIPATLTYRSHRTGSPWQCVAVTARTTATLRHPTVTTVEAAVIQERLQRRHG